MWKNCLRLEMINIQHTPSKNDMQVFAELLEDVLVGAALEISRAQAVAVHSSLLWDISF